MTEIKIMVMDVIIIVRHKLVGSVVVDLVANLVCVVNLYLIQYSYQAKVQ